MAKFIEVSNNGHSIVLNVEVILGVDVRSGRTRIFLSQSVGGTEDIRTLLVTDSYTKVRDLLFKQ